MALAWDAAAAAVGFQVGPSYTWTMMPNTPGEAEHRWKTERFFQTRVFMLTAAAHPNHWSAAKTLLTQDGRNHRKLRKMLVLPPQTQCELECLRGREGGWEDQNEIRTRHYMPQSHCSLGRTLPSSAPRGVSGGNVSYCEMAPGAERNTGTDTVTRALQESVPMCRCFTLWKRNASLSKSTKSVEIAEKHYLPGS